MSASLLASVFTDVMLEMLPKLVSNMGLRLSFLRQSGVEARVEASETVLISESLDTLACVLKDSVTDVLTLSLRSVITVSDLKGNPPFRGPGSLTCVEALLECVCSTADPGSGLSVEIVIAGDGIPRSFMRGWR